MTRTITRCLGAAAALVLASCGGGGGSGGDPSGSHRVGGSIAGLAGDGLVLQNNGGDDLTLEAGVTTFQFPTAIQGGAQYAVTVRTQPHAPAQQCVVANGSGTMGGNDVTNVSVSCTTPAFTVGGTVTGLTGTGLVLQNNAADDLSVSANATSFQFPAALPDNAPYSVTVATQPSNPAQDCVVANGAGAIAGANVSAVNVTCTDITFPLATTVNGLSGGTLVLTGAFGGAAADVNVTANGPVASLTRPLAPGTAYQIAVRTLPSSPAQACTVTNGSGTITNGPVNVTVTCSTSAFTIGGSVSGLGAAGLRLRNSAGSEIIDVPSGASSFTFVNAVASGAPYAVTVEAQPSGLTCSVVNGTGTMGTANVTNVAVSCGAAIVQRWTAPANWGARWPASPTLVQHAWFDGSQIVEDGSDAATWTVEAGTAPGQREFKGFPAGSRWGAGPFSGQRYQAAGDDGVAALTGDMIVCALFKPDHNPPAGIDKPIIAKGITNELADVPGGGWALTQTRKAFTFHYEYIAVTDGATHHNAASVPTFFADETTGTDNDPASVSVKPNSGPLNASYVVFCGGRSGNQIYAAANSVALDYTAPGGRYGSDVQAVGPATGASTQLDAGAHPLTIGGFDDGVAAKAFGGRVYETAIWAEAGTPANIQAKLAQIQGLEPGSRYVRNREAPFYGADAVAGDAAAGYHTAWNDGPRIDPAKGFLFGLQAWNRVGGHAFINTPENPVYVYAIGENPELTPIVGVVRPSPLTSPPGNTPGWRQLGGATVSPANIEPPGDSERASVKLVTLPVGGRLETTIRGFPSAGMVHGQIWLRVPSATAGRLRVHTGYDGVIGSDHFDIDLAGVTPGTWSRVWLYRAPGGSGNELWTDGTPANLWLESHPNNPGPISFSFWGLSLTQLSTAAASGDSLAAGSRLGAADPGAEMYDWNVEKDASNYGTPTNAVDALQLAPVPASTNPGGFCLSADATMPSAMPWTALFTAPRTALAWVDRPLNTTRTVKLYLSGATTSPIAAGRLCLSVSGGTPVCAAVPVTFAAGSKHTITGCVSSAGLAELFADGNPTPIGGGPVGAAVPDLFGGTLLVGGASVVPAVPGEPWNGYVSKALICRNGNLADCQ